MGRLCIPWNGSIGKRTWQLKHTSSKLKCNGTNHTTHQCYLSISSADSAINRRLKSSLNENKNKVTACHGQQSWIYLQIWIWIRTQTWWMIQNLMTTCLMKTSGNQTPREVKMPALEVVLNVLQGFQVFPKELLWDAFVSYSH